jgi:hypothetical protein
VAFLEEEREKLWYRNQQLEGDFENLREGTKEQFEELRKEMRGLREHLHSFQTANTNRGMLHRTEGYFVRVCPNSFTLKPQLFTHTHTLPTISSSLSFWCRNPPTTSQQKILRSSIHINQPISNPNLHTKQTVQSNEHPQSNRTQD